MDSHLQSRLYSVMKNKLSVYNMVFWTEQKTWLLASSHTQLLNKVCSAFLTSIVLEIIQEGGRVSDVPWGCRCLHRLGLGQSHWLRVIEPRQKCEWEAKQSSFTLGEGAHPGGRPSLSDQSLTLCWSSQNLPLLILEPVKLTVTLNHYYDFCN